MSKYAAGKLAIGICDVCGFQFRLPELRPLVVNERPTEILACRDCWTPDHPQLLVGKYPVMDPQALRNPRPDTGRTQSRVTQWGWNPVGGGDGVLTPNDLVAHGAVGTVTVTVS